jgi:hypothetical protein
MAANEQNVALQELNLASLAATTAFTTNTNAINTTVNFRASSKFS